MARMNFDRLYTYRFKDVDQRDRQRVWTVIGADIYRRMNCPKVLLDPASGRCEFLNAIPECERWAVDQLDHGAYRDPEIKAVVSDIFAAELPTSYFDGVFVSNFLEHLPSQDSIADLLRLLRSVMLPGARIAILGPNFKHCWQEYFDCADHVIPLTHISVQEHLYAAGFSICSVLPRYLPYSFRSVMPASPHLVRLYLSLPMAWRALGKQFLVVGTPDPTFNS